MDTNIIGVSETEKRTGVWIY